jgi:hypothetical protein
MRGPLQWVRSPLVTLSSRSVQGTDMTSPSSSCEHQLLYASLFDPGRGVSIPCDAHGKVHMDDLSEHLKNAYLGARALVGREYALPIMEPMHSLH